MNASNNNYRVDLLLAFLPVPLLLRPLCGCCCERRRSAEATDSVESLASEIAFA